MPYRGVWAEVFSSDAQEFGGGGVTNGSAIKTQDVPMHGCDQSISLTLPGCSVFFLECVKKTPKRARRTTTAKTDPSPKTTRAAKNASTAGKNGTTSRAKGKKAQGKAP